MALRGSCIAVPPMVHDIELMMYLADFLEQTVQKQLERGNEYWHPEKYYPIHDIEAQVKYCFGCKVYQDGVMMISVKTKTNTDGEELA